MKKLFNEIKEEAATARCFNAANDGTTSPAVLVRTGAMPVWKAMLVEVAMLGMGIKDMMSAASEALMPTAVAEPLPASANVAMSDADAAFYKGYHDMVDMYMGGC